MMFLRQASFTLLKRLRIASQFASSSGRPITTASYSKIHCVSHYDSERFRRQPRGSPWMLLYGKAALLMGCSYAYVFAEEISSAVTSEGDAGGSNNVGLQRVEDGSVISNEHTSKWRIYTDNGRDFFMQGKLKEAEKFFSSALVEAKGGFGELDPHVASACNNLAELYRVKKAYDKAEPLYLNAIKILEESFGPDDVRVAAAFHNLGQFYLVQRKLDDARFCYERALKIKRRVLGPAHSDFADTMFHLGTVLYLQGNMKDAEALIQDSIQILEEGGQAESYTCIRKLRYLAQIYSKSSRLQDAENVQRKILHVMELTKGWDSMDTVIAAESLSVTLQSMGKLRDARELLEKCLDVRRTLLPEDHIQIGANMLNLASVVLLNSKQRREIAASETIMDLNRAKELLTNSIRIAKGIVDGTKQKKNVRNSEQQIIKTECTALIILLQSLKTLALVEMAKQEVLEKRVALPVHEAELALRQCICDFRKYGTERSASTSVDAKNEYLLCLKHLVKLRDDTIMKNGEQTQHAELQDLKDEIKRAEAEMSTLRKL